MIELRPIQKENVNSFYQWLNDEEVIKYSLSLFQKLNSKEEIQKWFNTIIDDRVNLNKGIYIKGTNIFIGYAGISNISTTNKSGEYYIFIGDKDCWGKGYGTATTTEIIKIGFTEMELNQIMLTVSEPNTGGLKAYQKAGFKLEGRLRQAAFRDHEFHDKIVMSILKEEYQEKI
ncbi:GNAT family N-acetyltransferase [Flammeovirga yaeyamensis]|uniref:GNAT family N-acetyltransferase n=1 Tax=Flammeovirga yaeyamensis TaxID=367791 RepID=A0AAX1MZ49_9BACT|nr:GNAT family protein [Flammeovirga yaeyamensis]MBB3700854.1 RimJ/RimL family protein N-acetyltransferase [Flammeovirga yaeyamensis]NMF37962.1 GNAT family N-acetyltransferase [Flammeovirga yaeyamensis]QWG00614.1 GNAT family N-acetyltransferase [Flammeovirga yaeyamensis]